MQGELCCPVLLFIPTLSVYERKQQMTQKKEMKTQDIEEPQPSPRLVEFLKVMEYLSI